MSCISIAYDIIQILDYIILIIFSADCKIPTAEIHVHNFQNGTFCSVVIKSFTINTTII